MIGKLWASAKLWPISTLLSRATLSVVSRVQCKSYPPSPDAWAKT